MDANEALREDPDLGPLVDRYGPVTVEPAEDLFGRLVVSIVRQQVSMDAAAAIRARLFDAVTVTPAGILAAEEATLAAAGLSTQKITSLNALARAFEREDWSRATFERHSDERVRAMLMDIRGIGPWTADMALLFGLGRKDVFPVGDLGVRKAMTQLFEVDREDRDRMTVLAERWVPHRSYATKYLWRLGDNQSPE
ncbi:MAG: DNA-3-methyladenine glycosylase [Halobacteriaceae archaeon]